MWIVLCHIFFHNVFHLSTMFIHSSTLPVHQPFESIMGKSGVKTRSSEQSVLPVDADFLLVTDSSSEEDSETHDHVFQLVIIYVNYAPPCSQASYMWIISCHLFFHCIFHLSTICVYWSTLHVYQPFEPVMEKSGVKIRSSGKQWYLLKHISWWL